MKLKWPAGTELRCLKDSTSWGNTSRKIAFRKDTIYIVARDFYEVDCPGEYQNAVMIQCDSNGLTTNGWDYRNFEAVTDGKYRASDVIMTNTPRTSIEELKARRSRNGLPELPKPPLGTESILGTQVGGSHYTDCKIQPIEYIWANGLPFSEGNIIKYVTRWRKKGGLKDLEKARHHIDLLIEHERAIQASPPTSGR